jgi:hypothetical protein
MDNRIIVLLLGLLTVAMILGMGWMKAATEHMRDEIAEMKRRLAESEGHDESECS